jgi:hypothetical protein
MITGSCMCGQVRFLVDAPFTTAGYCHCGRCQHRTGTFSSAACFAPAGAVTILQGEEQVRTWKPEQGFPKAFCATCGGHVWAGVPGGDGLVAIRAGTLESDPGIEPRWHQWMSSVPDWHPMPADGLPQYPEGRDHD